MLILRYRSHRYRMGYAWFQPSTRLLVMVMANWMRPGSHCAVAYALDWAAVVAVIILVDTVCLVDWAVESQRHAFAVQWASVDVVLRTNLHAACHSFHFEGSVDSNSQRMPCLMVATSDDQHLPSSMDSTDTMANRPFVHSERHTHADKLHNCQLQQTIPNRRLFDASIWFWK